MCANWGLKGEVGMVLSGRLRRGEVAGAYAPQEVNLLPESKTRPRGKPFAQKQMRDQEGKEEE